MSHTFKVGDFVTHQLHHASCGIGKVIRITVGGNLVVLPERGEKVELTWFPTYCTLHERPSAVGEAAPYQLPKIQDVLPAAPKPANPKQVYGDKKPPLQLIHSIALLHESAAMHAGKLKYDENNYIDADVEIMTYCGAIRRHLDQYMAGERVDAKEKVHHLGAIRACAGILLTAEACGTLIDNRPVVGSTGYMRNATGLRSSYGAAFQATFDEVSGVIEHLNKLYPVKPA